jgi:hypothetical protein
MHFLYIYTFIDTEYFKCIFVLVSRIMTFSDNAVQSLQAGARCDGPYYRPGPTVLETKSRSDLDCTALCLRHPLCVALNVLDTSAMSSSSNNCRLFSSTVDVVDFTYNTEWMYCVFVHEGVTVGDKHNCA